MGNSFSCSLCQVDGADGLVAVDDGVDPVVSSGNDSDRSSYEWFTDLEATCFEVDPGGGVHGADLIAVGIIDGLYVSGHRYG